LNTLIENKKVQTLFDHEIERINEQFGNWEQVKAFRLLPRAFAIADGEITPTLKLKRKKIMENWKGKVDDIYRRD